MGKWNEVKDDNVKLLNEKLKLETEIKKNKNFSIMKHFKVVKKKKIKVESKKEDKIKKKEKAITENEKKLNKKKKVMEEEKKKRLYDRPAQDREEQIILEAGKKINEYNAELNKTTNKDTRIFLKNK